MYVHKYINKYAMRQSCKKSAIPSLRVITCKFVVHTRTYTYIPDISLPELGIVAPPMKTNNGAVITDFFSIEFVSDKFANVTFVGGQLCMSADCRCCCLRTSLIGGYNSPNNRCGRR